MVKVQESIECPGCGHEGACRELHTTDGSETFVCQNCSYVKRVFPVVDPKRSSQMEQKLRGLADKGRHRDVLDLLGYGDWPDHMIRPEVERTLKNGLALWEVDEIGRYVHRTVELGGHGSYLVHDKAKGKVSVRFLPADSGKRRRLIKDMLGKQSAEVVVKICEAQGNELSKVA